jgi:hypothetical protein
MLRIPSHIAYKAISEKDSFNASLTASIMLISVD